jgi:hypothetical protein
MYNVDGTLKGMAPILFNRFTEKARPGKLRPEELLEEATRRVYRDPDTQSIILPPWNLKKCLMDGSRLGEVKHGKKAIGQYLQALLIVDGDPQFGRVDYDGLHVCQGRIPPRTGPMVTLYRPKLDPGWILAFRLIIADTTIHPDTLQQIISFAGLLAGLGAWRPEYGRFVLDRFTVSGYDRGTAPAPAEASAKKKKAAA